MSHPPYARGHPPVPRRVWRRSLNGQSEHVAYECVICHGELDWRPGDAHKRAAWVHRK